jgi:acetyl-CoA C-acetyltransferase
MREVVVVSGVRTGIGTYGGSLKDIPPTELAAQVVRESLARAHVDGKDVGHVVFGHVLNTEPKDMYLSRVAAIHGGCAEGTPAFNVNRLCGSGLQAIVSASQAIMLGDCDIAIGDGAENMSRGPYASLSARWGARMGATKMVDMVLGALHDPFHTIHMGVTAENVAVKFGITREMQDATAVESHNRAERATAAGYFKDQIVPVMLKSKKGDVAYVTDEHFRAGCKMEDMAKLKPVFLKEHGTVTAGNASGINDAAAAVVLMDAKTAQARGAKPLARLVSYAHTGLDPAKVNPNGSGISLGHPIGATGALITVKALHELQRIQGKYALVTMCIGGGQGIAAIFERM